MRPPTSHRWSLFAVVALVAAIPAAALASGPARPPAGKWKVTALFGATAGGGFTVSRDQRSVSGLTVKTGSMASTVCPKGTLVVSGKLKLSTATRGGSSIWIVGRNTPRTGDGISTIAVKVKNGGAPVSGGQLKLAFQTRRGGNGELDFPSGCTISFDVAR